MHRSIVGRNVSEMGENLDMVSGRSQTHMLYYALQVGQGSPPAGLHGKLQNDYELYFIDFI
jgi:hypothetical protein